MQQILNSAEIGKAKQAYGPMQGPTNTVPGRPGQAENFTGQVFCFLKKPAGPWRFTDELFCVIC